LRRKIIFPLLVILTLVGAVVFGVAGVSAQTPESPASTLVQLLAHKFGLKQTDVQAVFDQHRATRQKEMEAKYIEFLDQAVKNGNLTAAQKQLLVTKHQEFVSDRRADRSALKTWAGENNIDLKYLFGGFGHGRGGMRGMMGN